MARKNCSNIGGQAVMEGVMMRGPHSMATAVRNPKGEIVIESSRFVPPSEKHKIYKVPIIRGVINFFGSMVGGIKILNRSTEVYGDLSEEEPTKFEKWLAKTFKVDIMNVMIAVAVVLAVALSIGLFVIIPQLISTGIFELAKWSKTGFGMSVAYNLIAGFIRMAIFIGYIAVCSCVKDVKRVFMYHGAEHKVISCFEHGMDLTVENAQKMTTVHDRCGTTFMFVVMAISILFFAVFPVDILPNKNVAINFILRVLTRIIMIPLVAGISYEFFKLFAKYDNVITRICKQPGLWLQKLTTKQPTDDMVEVSIAAFKEVEILEKDKDYPIKTFVTFTTIEKTLSELSNILTDKNEIELILMRVTGADNKTQLYDGRRMTAESAKKAKKYAHERAKGAPLQYVLGVADFYGRDFKTDTRALIPRFDTEILVEQALKLIDGKDANFNVLDLCTGSGAIAVTIAKEADVTVTATDISQEAIDLASENATQLDAKVTFIKGDLFRAVKGKKFDMIISNPPYIQSLEIATLSGEVRDYEPRLALDGGADGLDFYRDICAKAKDYLNDGGYLLLEVGIYQADLVKDMMKDYDVTVVNDYNNPPIPRVVIGKKNNNGESINV